MSKMYIDRVTGVVGEATDLVVFESDNEFEPDTNVSEFFENLSESDVTDFADDVVPVELTVDDQLK